MILLTQNKKYGTKIILPEQAHILHSVQSCVRQKQDWVVNSSGFEMLLGMDKLSFNNVTFLFSNNQKPRKNL